MNERNLIATKTTAFKNQNDRLTKMVDSPKWPFNNDVLGVFNFQIPCFRPESPALYPKSLPTFHEGHGRKLGHLRLF